MTADFGFRVAQAEVSTTHDDNVVLIWSAIPCTGGSPWQNINKCIPGGKERIQEHLKLFRALWNIFVSVVDWLSYA